MGCFSTSKQQALTLRSASFTTLPTLLHIACCIGNAALLVGSEIRGSKQRPEEQQTLRRY